MAAKTWLGSTDSDGQLAANWSGAAVPVAGDNWIFNEQAVRPMLTNLNFGTPAFTTCDIAAGYKYGVGGLGEALIANFTGASGKVRIGAARQGIFLGVTTPTIEIHSTSGTSVTLVSGGSSLIMQSGLLNIHTAFLLTATMDQIAGHVELADGTNFPAYFMYGGSLRSRRGFATLDIAGPGTHATMTDIAEITTKATVRPGALLNYRSRVTLANLEVQPAGGFSRNEAVGAATITNMTIFAGAAMRLEAPGVTTDYDGSGSSNPATKKGQLLDTGLLG